MPTATEDDTISVDELEGLFDLEIPCGGNGFPVERPCPYDAAATLVSSHRCRPPTAFKCFQCFMEWFQASEVWSVCSRCGERMPAAKIYGPL